MEVMNLSMKTGLLAMLISTIFNIEIYARPMIELHKFEYNEEIEKTLVYGHHGRRGLPVRRITLKRS